MGAKKNVLPSLRGEEAAVAALRVQVKVVAEVERLLPRKKKGETET